MHFIDFYLCVTYDIFGSWKSFSETVLWLHVDGAKRSDVDRSLGNSSYTIYMFDRIYISQTNGKMIHDIGE